MGDILARERNSLQTMEEPGDYVVRREAGKITAVWAILPNGQQGRIPSGEWEFTEDEHGHLSATPSIHDPGGEDREGWHGYLDHGTWREV